MSEHKKKVDEKLPDNDQAVEKLVLTSPDAAATPKDLALWIGVMLLAIFVVYSPALSGKFLWEDETYLAGNPLMRSSDGLSKMWGSPRISAQYRPLTDTVFWIEYQLAHSQTSAELNPLVFHLVNVLLHATSAALLWFVLRRLALPGAWLAAVLWAVHPVNVESAAWISQLGNPLSAALLFGSALAWLQFEGIGEAKTIEPQDQKMDSYGVSLLLFVGALLSNPMICATPIALLLILWWKREKVSSRQAMLLAPFLVLGAVMAGIAFWAAFARTAATEADLSAAQRVLLVGRAVWFYLAKLVAPIGLNFLYPKWDFANAAGWWWIFPLAAPIVLIVLLAMRGRIGKAPFVTMTTYFVMLIPPVVMASESSARLSYLSDQHQYHASVAIIALIVGAIASAVGRAVRARAASEAEPSPLPYAIAGIVVVALGAAAVARANVFSGPIPLWRDVLAKNPTSGIAHNNLGRTLFEDALKIPPAQRSEEFTQMLDEAEAHFAEAIKLNPSHAKAYANWGAVLLFREKAPEAQEKYERAVTIDPQNIDAIAGLARSHFMQKHYAEAVARYREAAKLADADRTVSPVGRADLHASLGEALAASGDDAGALQEYAGAAGMAPELIKARLGYGKLLLRQGKLADAAREFDVARKLDPNNIDAHVELAKAMMRANNLFGAETSLLMAKSIDEASPLFLKALAEWNARSVFERALWFPFRSPPPRPTPRVPATTRATTKLVS